MSRRINHLSDYTPVASDTFLLDTNILIKLFYPVDFDNKSEPYEDYYRKLLSAKCTLALTSIQVSEFINRCIRIQYNLYKNEHPEVADFKRDYRGTEDYANRMKGILQILKTVIPRFTLVNDDFAGIGFDNIINHNFSFDFNDAFIMAFAQLHNAIVLTDDRDFASYSSSAKIVTNNSKLLMFS